MGFADEIGRILDQLPKDRQNLFFSATFPPTVDALAKKMLRNPATIEAQPVRTLEATIRQRAIEVDASRRTQLLCHLIRESRWDRVLVFVATKHATEKLAAKLGKAGIKAAAFHGELSQGARNHVLAEFKACRLQVVIATDLAARGIDIEQLPAVVNYDLPRSAVDYTHRIGRTGRAGESGTAVSFISAASEPHFRLIEKRQRLRLPREQISGFEPIETTAPVTVLTVASAAELSTGGIKGKRKSKKDKLREAAAREKD
jgi:superfamily II DNA/RNA helicase